jgi:hypothetical protein
VTRPRGSKPPIGLSCDPTSIAHEDARLTDELARKVLGWRPTPDRFIKSGRRWIPKWRFNPLARLEDAFTLLDHAGGAYVLSVGSDRVFAAEVRIGERIGMASGEPKARAVTLAIARALHIEVA